jgi:hypothetical protein
MNALVSQEHQSLQAISPDQMVDMFTERGFALANRIAKAFASSDAVPAQFRMHNLKRVGKEEKWVENPSAIGNCLIAIEVARAVNMSITAVMQNADMIEGKLRWSGKFVIAAINASGRFTPLRFQMRDLGPIQATYKEKTGWDEQARRPTFAERTVDVNNVECIAWALPKGYRAESVYTLQQARDANMPVIESAPVTMKMAVEEGWYGKAGSKWQTELRTLMFQYRAGSFFGNIHAPDIVMGMGRTAEEAVDIGNLEADPDGVYVPAGKPVVAMPVARAEVPAAPAQPTAAAAADPATGETTPPPAAAKVIDQADGPDVGAVAPAAPEPTAPPKQRAPSEPGAMATEGERKFILNRAKSAGIDMAALCEKAHVEGLPADLAGLTKDQFIALKDELPKSV